MEEGNWNSEHLKRPTNAQINYTCLVDGSVRCSSTSAFTIRVIHSISSQSQSQSSSGQPRLTKEQRQKAERDLISCFPSKTEQRHTCREFNKKTIHPHWMRREIYRETMRNKSPGHGRNNSVSNAAAAVALSANVNTIHQLNFYLHNSHMYSSDVPSIMDRFNCLNIANTINQDGINKRQTDRDTENKRGANERRWMNRTLCNGGMGVVKGLIRFILNEKHVKDGI